MLGIGAASGFIGAPKSAAATQSSAPSTSSSSSAGSPGLKTK
jgi:hypothetical protein